MWRGLIASIVSLQTVHGRTLWRRPLNVICSALQSKGWTHKSVFSIYSYIYFLWTRVMHNKRKQFESTHLWNSYLICNRRNESVNKWFLRRNELVVARRMVVDDRTQRCRGRCHGPSVWTRSGAVTRVPSTDCCLSSGTALLLLLVIHPRHAPPTQSLWSCRNATSTVRSEDSLQIY